MMLNRFKWIVISFVHLLFIVTVSSAEQPLDFNSDFQYLGAFKVPDIYWKENYKWDYGGYSLGFNPEGDSSGSNDGYLGSLYSASYNCFVSEISIPVPVNSTDLSKLNRAETLTPFHDITQGKLFLTLGDASIKRLRGLTYLSHQVGQDRGKMYWAFMSDYNVSHINYPGYGYSDMNIDNPNAQGPWNVAGYVSNAIGGYLFDIPKEWADNYLDGKYIAGGFNRNAGTQCHGPGLIATAPYKYTDTNPPVDGQLPSTALIYYNAEHSTYPDYKTKDEWRGGSWITAGKKEAVIFVGYKCIGDVCYGSPEECNSTCGGSKGYHCSPRQPQMIFYNTDELIDVAKGLKKPWEVKPYHMVNLVDYIPLYKECSETQGATYDRLNNLLYVIQMDGDTSGAYTRKPLIHVLKVGKLSAGSQPSTPQNLIIK